jgi:hypothetical protein
MELELYSDLEGKIPFGAQQALVVKLLRQHFRIIDNARMRAAKAEKFDLAVQELQKVEEGNLALVQKINPTGVAQKEVQDGTIESLKCGGLNGCAYPECTCLDKAKP